MIRLYRNVLQLHRAGTELPPPLVRTYRSHIVDVTPANSAAECGRCNRTYFDHLWLLVDSDDAAQGGVVDCAGVSA